MEDPVSSLRGWLHELLFSRDFFSRYPYYASVLSRFDPLHDDNIAIAAVSARGARFYLHVNAGYFQANPQFIRGVLLHEVHHVVLGHLSHPKFRGVAHPDLMLLAKEMSANDFIQEALPPGVTWQTFPQLETYEGESTMARYERLARARREGRLAKTECCGLGDLLAEDESGLAHLGRLILSAATEVDRGEGRPPRDEAGLLAGRTPGALVEELVGTSARRPSAVDWRKALRTLHARVRGRVGTFRWPNRRFPERVGEIPGRRRRNRDEVTLLAAIDTSGSMRTEDLEGIARELEALAASAGIVVVECDAAIQRVYPFEGRLESVMGRGGTDFRPVFEREFLQPLGVDGVVYFTDGFGPYPPSPPGIDTLWVLTEESRSFDCPWGEKAYLGPPRHKMSVAGERG
jgi:predicted metal-dependent peptidase